ncbi:MAG: hypothetical protein E7429_01540 [Ruminococcaceae bacterium]|nr:hypothetical protein [Oscillospiraceae bacterium]
MKRTLMLFMATALLVFSLASCGCSAQQAGTQSGTDTQNGSAVTGNDTGSNSSSGSANGQTNTGNGTAQTPNDPMLDSDGNVIDETIDDITGAVDNAGDALTGNDAHNTTGGVSYEQMLRNGRVRDRDGDLTDGENASVRTGR